MRPRPPRRAKAVASGWWRRCPRAFGGKTSWRTDVLSTEDGPMDLDVVRFVIRRRLQNGRLPRGRMTKVQDIPGGGQMCDACGRTLRRIRWRWWGPPRRAAGGSVSSTPSVSGFGITRGTSLIGARGNSARLRERASYRSAESNRATRHCSRTAKRPCQAGCPLSAASASVFAAMMKSFRWRPRIL